ncbi:MAG: hypothetical protein IT370_14155 [Deltaproteobacteria bacterium]|nr:hypothetical protein [Deltaproteobacteria bacterium]
MRDRGDEKQEQQTRPEQHEVPAGTGPVNLSAGFGWRPRTAYTESRGVYLGFGADFGADDLDPAAVPRG